MNRLCVPALVLIGSLSGAGDNLIVNGDLEKGGRGQAAGWSKLDGLTTFREKAGKGGYCIRFDTTVQRSDKQAHDANPEAFEGRTDGGEYATVGAVEGVWAFCAPIELDKDDKYLIIEVDVKGTERSSRLFHPKVLLRGYQEFDAKRDAGTSSFFHVPHEGGPAYSEQFGKEQREAREGDRLMVWRKSLFCRLPEKNKWSHFRMGIKLPTTPRYRPEILLVKPYAMWPLGSYWFDNVVLRRCTKAEYDQVRREGHSAKEFM